MSIFYAKLLVFSSIACACASVDISDEDYKLLPPIFYIDPYDECVEQKNIFCRISLKLSPLQENRTTKIWDLIEQTKQSERHYNHDELFYALCVNASSADTVLKNELAGIYTEKYRNLGLKATVTEANCNNFQYKYKVFDFAFLTVIGLYILLIISATFSDFKTLGHISKYVLVFSVRHNLQKLGKTYKKCEFRELRCIQSLRFYTTVLIISCHTFCSFAGAYVSDTKYLEDFSENPIRHSLRNSFVFLVQTFFLISAWLLSYKTFKLFENVERVQCLKLVFVTSIKRYLRILPPLLFVICLGRSIWVYGSFRGPVTDVYSDREYEQCQENWWINLLFLNNHYKQNNMCYFTTWYLAADTQLYFLSLLVISIISKLPQKILALSACICLGIIVPSIISYIYGLDIIFRIIPENSKNNMFKTFVFNATYTATYANMATYMLGLLFGYLYYKLENRLFLKNKLVATFWWIICFTCTTLALTISSYKFDRISSALIAGVLKPMYALGFGLAILGISQGTGGTMRYILHWKPAILLGNFSYSTYVIHFGIIFYRAAVATQPLPISDYILFVSFVRDVVLSFLCGFVLHLLLEMPALQLQTLIIPKYRPERKEK